MTKKLTHTLYALLGAGVIAAVPALSAAEGDQPQGQQQGQGQQEGKKGQGQAQQGQGQQGQQQGQAQQGQGQQGQQQGQQGQARQGQQQGAKRLSINESVTLPLANGCSYSATVNGTVTPVKGGKQRGQAQQGQQQGQAQQGQQQGQAQQGQQQGQAQQGQQHVSPDLQVTASVICPNQATLVVSENVTRTGAITRDELEEAIERRGTIFTGQEGRHCAFVPDFELTTDTLEGIGVAYMCAMTPGQQGQQQQRQGG